MCIGYCRRNKLNLQLTGHFIQDPRSMWQMFNRIAMEWVGRSEQGNFFSDWSICSFSKKSGTVSLTKRGQYKIYIRPTVSQRGTSKGWTKWSYEPILATAKFIKYLFHIEKFVAHNYSIVNLLRSIIIVICATFISLMLSFFKTNYIRDSANRQPLFQSVSQYLTEFWFIRPQLYVTRRSQFQHLHAVSICLF